MDSHRNTGVNHMTFFLLMAAVAAFAGAVVATPAQSGRGPSISMEKYAGRYRDDWLIGRCEKAREGDVQVITVDGL